MSIFYTISMSLNAPYTLQSIEQILTYGHQCGFKYLEHAFFIEYKKNIPPIITPQAAASKTWNVIQSSIGDLNIYTLYEEIEFSLSFYPDPITKQLVLQSCSSLSFWYKRNYRSNDYFGDLSRFARLILNLCNNNSLSNIAITSTYNWPHQFPNTNKPYFQLCFINTHLQGLIKIFISNVHYQSWLIYDANQIFIPNPHSFDSAMQESLEQNNSISWHLNIGKTFVKITLHNDTILLEPLKPYIEKNNSLDVVYYTEILFKLTEHLPIKSMQYINSTNKQLTVLEAYYAMTQLLNSYYNKTSSDDIGSLLGIMQFCQDGTTIDTAIWKDWLDSIEKALNQPLEKNQILTELQAFQSMIKFLELYVEFTSSEDTIDLLKQMINPETKKPNPQTWNEWINYIDIALKEKDIKDKLLLEFIAES